MPVARTLSILILLAMGTTWGLQVAMLKMALESGYRETQVMLCVLSLVALAYFAILVIRRSLYRFTRTHISFYLITAALGYLIPMAATLFAARELSAGMLALLISLAPLFTFAAAALFRTEKISVLRVSAMLLGIVATFMVLLPQTGLPDFGLLPWMLLALLIPFCYGIESVYIDVKWPEGLDVLQVGFGEAFFAMVLVIPLMLVWGDPLWFDWRWNQGSYAILIFAACGVIEVIMYFWLIRTTGGVLVSFATFVSLFAGIGWGILLFAESHGQRLWLAVAVLVGALLLVSIDAMQTRRRIDASHTQ